MKRLWNRYLVQLLSGNSRYSFDSLKDLIDEKDNIEFGRKGAKFYGKGNYSINIIQPSISIEMHLATTDKKRHTVRWTSPGFAYFSQFISNETLPIMIMPDLFASGKMKNSCGSLYISNPVLMAANMNVYSKEERKQIEKNNAQIGLILVECEVHNGIKHQKRKLEKHLQRAPQPIGAMTLGY